MTEYQGSTLEKPLDIINLHMLEDEARKNMQVGAFGYLREGAEDEYTLKQNLKAWDTKRIIPRMLRGVGTQDTRTSLFGIDISMPIIQAPVAAQKLSHVEGENATAKACADVGTIFCLSAYGSTLISEAHAIAPDAPQFFQIYMSKNDGFNRYILGKARDNGVKAIVLTADATVAGYREDDIINKFVFPFPLANLADYAAHVSVDNAEVGSNANTSLADIYEAAKQALVPEDIARIKEYSGGLPVIVKGIQCAEDALIAIGAGADGIWVSNHGGRQLDGGPGSFEVLASIAQAVNGQVPIIFDSGIRRGSHVFKAIASGADVVALGRPVLYGLNLGGAQGVESVYNHLNNELKIVMQLAGTPTIDAIKHAKLIGPVGCQNPVS